MFLSSGYEIKDFSAFPLFRPAYGYDYIFVQLNSFKSSTQPACKFPPQQRAFSGKKFKNLMQPSPLK
jgi:hypothetical protein